MIGWRPESFALCEELSYILPIEVSSVQNEAVLLEHIELIDKSAESLACIDETCRKDRVVRLLCGKGDGLKGRE